MLTTSDVSEVLKCKLVNLESIKRRRFRKAQFKNVFRTTLKREAGVFNSFRSEERFRKGAFLWRISVDSWSSRRNKAAFLNFPSVVWMES